MAKQLFKITNDKNCQGVTAETFPINAWKITVYLCVLTESRYVQYSQFRSKTGFSKRKRTAETERIRPAHLPLISCDAHCSE